MHKQKDLKRSEFSSLDIFLFSNGQQHSPPRKYNLRADELSWWEATLNYLARSQYGSNHATIELYTVGGARVPGPRALRPGAAYVAVPPPDSFIPSGYEKYLMKASRSWEKRQERKDSNGVLIESDENYSNNKEEVQDARNSKIPQNITTIDLTSTIAEEQAIVQLNANSKPKPNEQRTSTSKQMQKAKTSGPQQNPSILRKKYVNPVKPMTKKNTSLLKESSKVTVTTKKKTDSFTTKDKEASLSKSKVPGTTKTIEHNVEVLTEKSYSSPQPAHEEFQRIDRPSITKVLDEIPENVSLQNPNNKSDTTENDTLSHLYDNEEHHQSIFLNPKIPSITNDEKDHPSYFEPGDIDQKVMINSSATNTSEKANYSHSRSQFIEVHEIESETNITRAIDASATYHKKTTVAGSQTAENFVVFVNQGETVNLTLNIEIKNVNGSTSIDIQNSTHPDSNTPNGGERQGKVDIIVGNEYPNKSYCEEGVLKSWQSPSMQIKKIEDQYQETMNDMNITICQCSCCSNSQKLIPAPFYFIDKNNYFILLPSEKANGNLLGCNCSIGIKSENRASTDDTDILVVPMRTKDSVELLHNKFSVPDMSSKKIDCDQCPKCRILSNSLLKEDRQANNVTNERSISVRIPTVTDYEATRPSSTGVPKTFNDTWTQTDWTNVLMEARIHEDGRYSFHMPPLEVLKLHNAL